MKTMRRLIHGEVLVAVSFAPYAEETLAVSATALARGARLVLGEPSTAVRQGLAEGDPVVVHGAFHLHNQRKREIGRAHV